MATLYRLQGLKPLEKALYMKWNNPVNYLHLNFWVGILLLGLMVVIGPAGLGGTPALIQYKVYGTVRDAETGKGLMLTNITVKGTTKGTTTDKNGKYNLFLPPGSYELLFTYMGYSSVKKAIQITNRDVALDVRLRPIVLPLPAITVTPGENPALRIIKKAIENKKRIRKKLRNYRLTAYTKLIADVRMGKGVAVMGISDSAVTMIMETKTDAYWEKPDKHKEIILARKQSAFLPAVSNLLTSSDFIEDFSKDLIEMADNEIAGPLSPAGLKSYYYSLIGTTVMDSLKIHKIRISQLRDHHPLLQGTIYIADGTYALMMVDLELTKAALPLFFTQLHYKQRYELFENLFWMPVNLSLQAEGKISMIIHLQFSLKALSVLQDYRINKPFKGKIFDRVVIKVLPEADKRDSLYWAKNQLIPPTTEDIRVYEKGDSLKVAYERKRNRIRPRNLLFGKHLRFGEEKGLRLPGILESYRFNRVEGHALHFGTKTWGLLPNLRFLNLHLGYGFEDKRFKYAADIGYHSPWYANLDLRVGVSQRLGWIDEGKEGEGNLGMTLLSLLGKYDWRDFFYRRGWRASLEGDFHPLIRAWLGFSQGVYSNARKNTEWSLLRKSWKYRQNPPINEGKDNSLYLGLSLDPRKFIDNAGRLERIGGKGYQFVDVGISHSDKRLLASDFSYTKLWAYIRGDFDLHRLGMFSYRLYLGTALGWLPTQRIFRLPANLPHLTSPWRFHTLKIGEFSGDRYYSLLLEQDLGGQPFRWLKIPLLRNSQWGLILFGSAGWIDIGDRSRSIQVVEANPTGKPFYELGFGVDHIFTIFRIDLAWRLNHFREGRNFAIGLSVPF